MQFKSHYFIRDAWDQFYACKTAMMEGPSINDFSKCVLWNEKTLKCLKKYDIQFMF